MERAAENIERFVPEWRGLANSSIKSGETLTSRIGPAGVKNEGSRGNRLRQAGAP